MREANMARIPPDANDVIVIRLAETLGTTLHPNTGTAGSAADFTDYGNPISGVVGPLGNAVYMPGNIISSNHDGVKGGNSVEITPNVSVSAWIFIRRFSGGFSSIFNKQYSTGVWSNPFLSIGWYINNSTDGRWTPNMCTAGTYRFFTTGSNLPLPQGKWCHIGETWNGTTLTAYLNGTSIGTLTPGGGAIDYGGTDGPWFAGSVPDTGTTESPTYMIQDIRVANVVRPQSYFSNIYYNGLYVNG